MKAEYDKIAGQFAQDTEFSIKQLSVLDKPDGQQDKSRIGLLLRKVGE